MSAPNFDPYLECLPPPTANQNNRYRLLGLELFESNRYVIESAFLQQNACIRDLRKRSGVKVTTEPVVAFPRTGLPDQNAAKGITANC